MANPKQLTQRSTAAFARRAMIGITLASALIGGSAALDVSAAAGGNQPGAVHLAQTKSAPQPRVASSNLTYHGGTGGYGVETGADRVYIVQWGWTADPSGEGARQQAFFQGVGGALGTTR